MTAVLEGEITAVCDTLANTAQLRAMDIWRGRRDIPRSEVRPPGGQDSGLVASA